MNESEYYSRQTILPEVGLEGQEKLRQARVLVVGAGGLGCPALSYLAGAGVGTIGICESDDLDVSNLHRQILFDATGLSQPKVALAVEGLRKLNPFIVVREHAHSLNPANAFEICADYDFILDCTDNFATKFLLNDTAAELGKTLIYASIYQYEGQLFVCEPGGPCLRCFWPEQPPAGCVGSCAEAGVLGYVAGVFGTLQAGEAIKRILGMPGDVPGGLALLDLVSMDLKRIQVSRDANCPCCGTGQIPSRPWWEIVASSEEDLKRYTIIDIREDIELRNEPLPVSADYWAPMSRTLPEAMLGMSEGNLLLVCRKGIRTAQMASYFEEMGERRVYSLAGGLFALRDLLNGG